MGYFYGKKIYTLAQNGTANQETGKAIIIYGTGTIVENNPAILKSANKKAISNALVRAMADIAKATGNLTWLNVIGTLITVKIN